MGTVDRAAPADAVVVLGAAVADAQPTPVFRARLDHGVDLVLQGIAPRLVLTGGIGAGDRLAESEVGARYAEARGVHADAILTEGVSRTTSENLEEAARLLVPRGWTRVVVVSDPYHLHRACLIARDVGLDPLPSPAPGTRYRTWRTKLPFLLRELYFLHQYQLGAALTVGSGPG